MAELKNCYYTNCYYNNNIEHTCTLDKITLEFTGTCENITHCDEYTCDSCDMYNLCTKSKKVIKEND